MKRSLIAVHWENHKQVEGFLVTLNIPPDRLLLWCLPSLEPVEKSEKRGERESCATAVIDDCIKVSIGLYTSQHSVSFAFSYFHFTQEFHLSAAYKGPWVKFTLRVHHSLHQRWNKSHYHFQQRPLDPWNVWTYVTTKIILLAKKIIVSMDVSPSSINVVASSEKGMSVVEEV